MTSLITAIYLLMGLMGFHPLTDSDKVMLSDPAYISELGYDINCPKCDQDELKKQFIAYQNDKDGGIIIDGLAAD